MFTFRKMTEADLPQVLQWRTSPEVTRFMLSDIPNSLDKQQDWFKKIETAPAVRYWIIETTKPVGVINIADIDLVNKSCSWGFYLGDHSARNLGGLVPPYLYNYLFKHTPIETIYAEVLDFNTQVIKLHRLHGYKGLTKQKTKVEKDGKVLALCHFALAKSDWQTKRRFHCYIADFALTV